MFNCSNGSCNGLHVCYSNEYYFIKPRKKKTTKNNNNLCTYFLIIADNYCIRHRFVFPFSGFRSSEKLNHWCLKKTSCCVFSSPPLPASDSFSNFNMKFWTTKGEKKRSLWLCTYFVPILRPQTGNLQCCTNAFIQIPKETLPFCKINVFIGFSRQSGSVQLTEDLNIFSRITHVPKVCHLKLVSVN